MCTLDGCGEHQNLPPLIVAETDRRAFLAGLLTLPLAAVLADPALAQAQGATAQPFSIDTMGGAKASGVIAKPKQWPAPAVVLVHEWWGLNDQIKSVAVELANQGYVAIAVDLFGGQVTNDPAVAKNLVATLNTEKALDVMTSVIYWARDLTEVNGKVGTCGWCFGGAWSLNASMAAPVNATVIYYGNVDRTVNQLESLVGPVLGHFATKDTSIPEAQVKQFAQNMLKADKPLQIYWYDADHAFANPTSARYDAADAALAWQRTLAFFQQNLTT
ncbi:dienelactone hydrolase family protein [Pseudoxanthobacter sp.]|uniref:dienelactone hydrolase family protein n=1 Tax=Pseudoxanthobacter sp. TaxID=1925742 RepID=UPI002FE3F804